MSISTAQMRGARGLLNWSQQDLSDRTGISSTSIGSIENAMSLPRESTMAAICKSFEDAGIEFLPNDGVRMRGSFVRTYVGRQGFFDFYEDVYNVAQNFKGTFLVNNVDEAKFLKFGQENLLQHSKRIQDLGNITYKILVQEGDYNFVASEYAEYRWLPKQMFSSVPFYVYGEKLAMIIFENQPTILVLDYPAITEAYRIQFNSIWDIAQTPAKKALNSVK